MMIRYRRSNRAFSRGTQTRWTGLCPGFYLCVQEIDTKMLHCAVIWQGAPGGPVRCGKMHPTPCNSINP